MRFKRRVSVYMNEMNESRRSPLILSLYHGRPGTELAMNGEYEVTELRMNGCNISDGVTTERSDGRSGGRRGAEMLCRKV